MHDAITQTEPAVELDAIHRIVVQPTILASDPDAHDDGTDALVHMYRSRVETFLRQRLACYAEVVEVDWSEGVGAAGPRGLAAITYGGDVLADDDEHMFDPRCDAHEAIFCAVDHCE
jgi:hypothetical protein